MAFGVENTQNLETALQSSDQNLRFVLLGLPGHLAKSNRLSIQWTYRIEAIDDYLEAYHYF